MAIVGWAAVCMVCLFQPFIRLWVGQDMLLSMPFVVCMCLYFYILDSGAISWVYHQGAGLWWEDRYVMIGECIANIILNIALCKLLGVIGIVLATVISVFFTNFVFCPKVIFREYFKNGKLKEYLSDHGCYAVTMLLSAGVSWLLCESLLPMKDAGTVGGIICIIGRLAVCTGISVGFFWLIWHKSERYSQAKGWLRRMMKAG